MKKRFISLVLAVLMVLSMVSTSAFAAETEDIAPETEDIFNDEYATTSNYELNIDTEPECTYNIADGIPLDSEDSPALYSATGLTDIYSGYLSSETEFSYVPVYVSEGSIVQATLICPENPNLNYNLSLCVADEDGYLTKIRTSNLKTYIDPSTGRTLDEGVSYVHNQASEGYLFIVVDSAKGSSSVDPFYLICSTDTKGSYDSYEPNDSPYYAKPISMTTTLPIRASISGSLNVSNDQDWYYITPSADVVVNLSTGDYTAEIYELIADETLGLATYNKYNGYYSLEGNQTYFVKVYTDVSTGSFPTVEYNLEITNQAKYTTIDTAYDLGYWLGSVNNGFPIWGQTEIFYKFRINTDDKMYVRITLPDDSEVQVTAYNAYKQPITGSISSWDRGNVITPSSETPFLVLPIDGTDVSGGYVYLRVTYRREAQSHPMPGCLTRIRYGSGEFKFPDKCTNLGGTSSNTISLNLTYNSTLPEGCIVTSASTKGSTTSSIGTAVSGKCHVLGTASHGWFTPRSNSVVSTANHIVPDNVPLKQMWYFRYDQSALAPTEMKDITMQLSWVQDIKYDNYCVK